MTKKPFEIKLCGFTQKALVDFACQFDISYLGFVFFDKSPRNVTLSSLPDLVKDVPNHIKKVAVTVKASDSQIRDIIKLLDPQILQLHGGETKERCEEIQEKFNLPIIKAFNISKKEDLENITEFEEICDYFLFDAKIKGEYGGSGQKFDWDLLNNLKTKKKWFLSGGIGIKNIYEIKEKTNAKILDLSSSIEEEKGLKSKRLIEEFMLKISNISLT